MTVRKSESFNIDRGFKTSSYLYAAVKNYGQCVNKRDPVTDKRINSLRIIFINNDFKNKKVLSKCCARTFGKTASTTL